MSYHRARVLPHQPPLRDFASAQDVWAQQRRYVVPALGSSGDGLSGFMNPGAGSRVNAPRLMLVRTPRGMQVQAAGGLGSTLVVI